RSRFSARRDHLQHLVAVTVELRGADAGHGGELLARAWACGRDRAEYAVGEDVERGHRLLRGPRAAPDGERVVDALRLGRDRRWSDVDPRRRGRGGDW